VAKSTPFSLRRDANGCRHSCQRNGAIPRSAHGIREPMAIYEQRLAGSVPHRPPTSISFAHRRAFVASSIAKACLCSSILCLGLRAASLGAAYLEYCRRTHLLRRHDLSARLTGIEVFEMCSWLNSVPCRRHRRFLVDDFFYPLGICQRRSREVICGGCRLGRGCDRAGRPGFAI
jgi:hypothetical protein